MSDEKNKPPPVPASRPPSRKPMPTNHTSPWGNVRPASVPPPVRPNVPTELWGADSREKTDSLIEIDPDDEELDNGATASELEAAAVLIETGELTLDSTHEHTLAPDDAAAAILTLDETRVALGIPDAPTSAATPIFELSQVGAEALPSGHLMTSDDVEAFVDEEAASSEVFAATSDSGRTFALESPELDSQERFAVSTYDLDPASTSSVSVQVPEERPRKPSLRPGPGFDEVEASRLYTEGDHRALFSLHTTFGKRPDVPPLDRAWHRLHAAEIAEGELADPQAALVEALGALEDAPTHPEANALVARLLTSVGTRMHAKLNEASRRLERKLDEHDARDRAGLRAVLARIALDLKKKDRARDHITELGRLDATHPLVLEQRANEARSTGDFQLQRKLLLESLQRFDRPDDRLRVHLELAELHAGPLHTPKRAAEFYRSALEDAPSNLVALRGMERLARQEQDVETVLDMLQRQVDALPKGKEALDTRVRAAEEFEKARRFEDALTLLEPAIESDAHRLKALAISERCKVETGDTRGVAQALVARAHLQQSVKAKVELLWQATNAQLSSHDSEGAVETLRLVVAADEKNQKAYAELERLLTSMGRLEEAVDCGIHVASLTKDKLAAAIKYVQLGEVLQDELSDRLSAKLQFEKALELDKKNLAALTHLEHMAEEAGDRGRADTLLERRAGLEPDAAKACDLYVQLATMREDSGNAAGRIAALESAHARDAQRIEVTEQLLNHFVQIGKWDRALPLSEKTIASLHARQSTHNERVRRRERTHILVSLGRTREAFAAAFETYDAFSDDNSVCADVIDVGQQVQRDVLVTFRPHIAAFYDRSAPTRADALLRLAELLHGAGELERCHEALERTLSWNHASPAVFALLEQVLSALGLKERLAEVKIEHAKHLGANERFAKLLQAGDIYARDMDAIDRAIQVFEQALPLKPDDPWLRETLAWAYEQVQDYRKLAAILRKDVTLAPTPERRGQILEELAGIVETHLGAPEEAAQLLEERLDADASALHVFERIVRGHTERRDWPGLERSYRRMLDRSRTAGDDTLKMTLWKQLVVLCRDRLGDDAKALDAAYAARSLNEKDPEVRGMIYELSLRTSRPDLEVAMLREWVKDEPLEPRHYIALYEHFLREREFDKAWLALDVLAQLVPLAPEHAEYYDDYPPFAPDAIGGSMTEEAWTSHLMHPDLDPQLTQLLRLLSTALLRTEGRIDAEPIPFGPSHSHAYEQIASVVHNGAEVLGVPAPPLFATHNGNPFQGRMLPPNSLSVAPSASELGESLTFEVGMALACQRTELSPLRFHPARDTYVTLLSRAAKGDPALFAAMDPMVAQEVRELLTQAANEGKRFDLKRWHLVMHCSTARAGLLLAGTAHGAALYYSLQTDDPQAADKLGELYQFAVSDAYADLRVAIGVAVGADQGS